MSTLVWIIFLPDIYLAHPKLVPWAQRSGLAGVLDSPPLAAFRVLGSGQSVGPCCLPKTFTGPQHDCRALSCLLSLLPLTPKNLWSQLTDRHPAYVHTQGEEPGLLSPLPHLLEASQLVLSFNPPTTSSTCSDITHPPGLACFHKAYLHFEINSYRLLQHVKNIWPHGLSLLDSQAQENLLSGVCDKEYPQPPASHRIVLHREVWRGNVFAIHMCLLTVLSRLCYCLCLFVLHLTERSVLWRMSTCALSIFEHKLSQIRFRFKKCYSVEYLSQWHLRLDFFNYCIFITTIILKLKGRQIKGIIATCASLLYFM